MSLYPEVVLHVRASRAAVVRALMQLPELAAGGDAAAQALQTRIGLTALGHVRDAFVVKSHGGTDAAGESWKPLERRTVAYSRRHPGLPPAAQRASATPSSALTPEQRTVWWKYYRQALAVYKGDQGHAAAVAWLRVRDEFHVETLLDKYGDTQVDILRDTGLLLNSLSPGAVVGPAGSPPPLAGAVPNQVFRTGRGEVILGTNRKHAADHHHGVPGRLPQRRLWPEPRRWPATWWADIVEQAAQGVIDITVYVLRRL